MSESFGARLRLERERRQIPLAAIAERSKIKLSLFEAIERDDASQWPSGIFRRSFMRAYAEAVGLDGEAIVAEFLERFPERVDAADALAIAVQAKPAAATPDAHAHAPGMRVTIAQTADPHRGGRLLAGIGSRCMAVAWDAGVLAFVSAGCFLVLGTFWKPLGVTALCYYLASILLLGNTPGVCLLAPRSGDAGAAPDLTPGLLPTAPDRLAGSGVDGGVFGVFRRLRPGAAPRDDQDHEADQHGYDWRPESRHI